MTDQSVAGRIAFLSGRDAPTLNAMTRQLLGQE
jgi:hypothetical protein